MNIKTIQEILSNISFRPSCIDMGWEWEVIEVTSNDSHAKKAFLIRTTFQRPDTTDGKIGVGYGRWMHVPEDVTSDGIVKTAWVCAELIVKHELMEAFQYKEARIFDPHKNLKALAYPQELKSS